MQRELANLTAAGIITREKSGVRINFRADSDCRGYEELLALVLASRELDPLLLEALENACPAVSAAVRSGEARPRMDSIDLELVILGDADSGLLRTELDRVELFTGMKIRETVIPPGDPTPSRTAGTWAWADPEHGILLTGRRSAFRRQEDIEPETSPEPDLFSAFGVDW